VDKILKGTKPADLRSKNPKSLNGWLIWKPPSRSA